MNKLIAIIVSVAVALIMVALITYLFQAAGFGIVVATGLVAYAIYKMIRKEWKKKA